MKLRSLTLALAAATMAGALSTAALAIPIVADGMGGYYTDDGHYYEGIGGYYTPDGIEVISDGCDSDYIEDVPVDTNDANYNF